MREYDYSEKKNEKAAKVMWRRKLIMREEEEFILRKRKEEEERSAANLTISHPEDAQEKQADAVAKKVVSGMDAGAEMKKDASSTTQVNAKKEEDGSLKGTEKLQNTLDSSKGGGQALDETTQSEMGEKMGADLSEVKIHSDHKAHEMSESINAKAFTHGQDIYFKQGNYNPDSNEGKELLAHELAHTVQNGSERKIQRDPEGDPEDEKRGFSIKIPPGVKSVLEFRRYAELQIFNQIVNLDWQANDGALKVYEDITRHVGRSITFTVRESTLAKYGIEKNDTRSGDKSYNELYGENKNAVTSEIDKRYYESTGVEPGTKIQPGDSGSAAIWNEFKRQVMAEKQMLDNLPPVLKEFLQVEGGARPEDYEKLVAIVELLHKLNNADFLDYKSKINFETTSLEELRDSIAVYLKTKEGRQKATESRETIKTKLYGLEELYNQYTSYTRFKANHEKTPYEPKDPNKQYFADALEKQRLLLEESLKTNGFDSIEQFGEYILKFENAFEQETITIAEDHLLRYKHKLFVEEKKLDDDAYVTTLFEALVNSGAKQHYEEADSKKRQARGITRDLGGYASGDMELKGRLEQEASTEKTAGDSSVSSIPSPLVQEEGFDHKGLAEVSSKEELKEFLRSYIEKKRTSVDETWTDIHAHPEHIYELDKLLAASMQVQQIEQGSIFDQIIQNKAKEINKNKILKAICFVIIAVALTVATFGAAAPVAIAAGIASAGISLYGVYEAVEEYKRKDEANEVGLLTDDPSLVWVVLAIAGAAIDVAALSAAFKAARPLSEAAKKFNETKDVALLEKQLATIEGLEVRLQENILKQARIQAQEEKLLQGLAETRKLTFATIPFLHQSGELLARAIFAIRKGIVSFEKFIDELKLAKVISETKLSPEDLLIVKTAFERARKAEKIGNAIFENTKNFHENLKCVEAFNQNIKFIKQQGKTLEIKEAFEIHVDVRKKADFIDYQGSKNPLIPEKEAISKNGIHKAVEIDGFIYDNINPNGVPSQEWFSNMMYFNTKTQVPQILTNEDFIKVPIKF